MLHVCRLAVALCCALALAQGAGALTLDNFEEGDFSVGPQPVGPPVQVEQSGLDPANVAGGTRQLGVLAIGSSLASASLTTTAGPDSGLLSTPVPNPPGCPFPGGCGGVYTLVYDGIANLTDDGSDGTLGLDLSGFQAIEIDAVVTRATQPVGPLGPLGPVICSIVPLPAPLCQPPLYLGFIPPGLCALGLCFPGAQLQLPPTRFQVSLSDSASTQVPVFLPLVTGTNRILLSTFTGVDLADIQGIRVRLNGVVGSVSVSEIRAAAVPVLVDLKPGTALNCVNPGSQGKVQVALLGSSNYDVLDVDASSLRFGGAAPNQCFAVEDLAPYDGFPDLRCKYKTQQVAWPAPGSDCGAVVLTGEETDGTEIEGSDVACLAGEPTCELGMPPLP